MLNSIDNQINLLSIEKKFKKLLSMKFINEIEIFHLVLFHYQFNDNSITS